MKQDRTWIDDVIQWTQKKKYDEVKRLTEDREHLEKDGTPTF